MNVEVPRDKWGRPLVVPPEGGRPVPYKRASSFADALEDKYHLELWKQRQVAVGVARDEHLRFLIEAHAEDKREMDRLVEKAKELAGSNEASERGTALHALTERLDGGADLSKLTIEWAKRDLLAYQRTVAPYEMVAVEAFVVIDELRVAGTFDRLMRFRGQPAAPFFIGDVKTSKPSSLKFGLGKFSIQLACYAHGQLYDPRTGERSPLPQPLDQDNGLIIHLPAGLGYCELHWIDLRKGWEQAKASLAAYEAQRVYRGIRDWTVKEPAWSR